jgi:hypothetical protein
VQQTINERLKILIDTLQMSARAFSAQLEVPESNTRNYLDKQTKLNSDYLQRIATHFKSANLSWLITGEGAPLIDDAQKSASTQQASIKNNPGIGISNGGNNTINNLNLDNCQRELEACQREVASLRRELDLQAALLAAKEETITLLRASYNRPN